MQPYVLSAGCFRFVMSVEKPTYKHSTRCVDVSDLTPETAVLRLKHEQTVKTSINENFTALSPSHVTSIMPNTVGDIEDYQCLIDATHSVPFSLYPIPNFRCGSIQASLPRFRNENILPL
ncbi:hypothetical protein CONPUDRAFT_134537 [Coniophora puteana RWD-64-598 SS2]|uniref:Uncharacterized protein n=1 Tax=Coniophora puteana (strain RWD-64-598) TaxID=741705 RepID=A0A5M3N910_CONPW|nr:uncharacterized protein CONPUDRAFT_134537 [Coniophora puteana RWD-64-598 SS2]EIW87325.1 hypothetical protein CONPUDRAFT_134537 [Coniophora puteana RWD-64-598 SS2]